MSDYLTTRELAEMLRIKERKVYDLAATNTVPHTKALGKLLFSRYEIEQWLAQYAAGPVVTPPDARPLVFLGSHDPLLDWALRESRSGIATYFDSSRDGLARFAEGAGLAAGIHIYEGGNRWNVDTVSEQFAREAAVMVSWARRQRGLVIHPKTRPRIQALADIAGLSLVTRQPGAGSQLLFDQLLDDAGLTGDVQSVHEARSETDVVLAVLENKAQVGFALESIARQYQMEFVPLMEEQFDVLFDRRAWFEPACQALVHFCQSDAFKARAIELPGYDIDSWGDVRFNGVG